MWGDYLIMKINPVFIPDFLIYCNELWHCDEKEIQNAYQLKITENGDIVTLNVYTTGKVQVQSSQENPFLNEVNENIKRVKNALGLKFNRNSHHLIIRAKTLFDYVAVLDIEQNVNRMAAIIICDTACEILLKVRIELICDKKNIPKRGVNIEDRKTIFEFIFNKGYIEVLEKKLKILREIRNKLVHQGDMPTQDDVSFAKDVLCKFLDM